MTMQPFMRQKRQRYILFIVISLFLAGCRRSPQARSAEYLQTGRRLLQNHDIPRAILQFRNAVQATPKNAEAYYQLGLAYLAGGNVAEAVRALRITVELNPKHAGAQLRMAQLMVAADDEGMLAEARQRITTLLQGDSSNAEMLQTYALTELKMGKVEEALGYLERALTSAPRELTLSALVAQTKLQQNDVKGAEEVLRKACENSPKSPDALVILGRFHVSQGRPREAEPEFVRALEMQPKHVGALANLAALQRNSGRKQEAEQNFKRLAGIPDHRVNYFYGIFLYEEGRRDEALREFDRLSRQDPDDREARSRLVAGYQMTNRFADAHRVLSDALKRNPNDLDAILQRGQLHLDAGKFAEAEADLNQVVHSKPDSAEVHFALSRLHQARGATRFQRQELNEALRLNPSLFLVRLELARTLIRDSMPKAALELLEALPANQKNLPGVIEQRNWALIAAGDAASARRGIDQGLQTAKNPILLLQDGLLKLAQKDVAGARAAAEESLRANPGDPRALSIIAGTYLAQNQSGMAIQKVREYAAQAAKFPAVQYYLGQMEVLSGNRQGARNAFQAAKLADANYPDADVALAQLDANDGKVDEAKKRLRALLAAKGEVLSARLLLAQLDVQDRNYAPAADFYRRMVVDYPANLVVLNNLAYSLVETGHYDEALTYAQQAKELAPDSADIDDTLGWAMYKKGVYLSAVQYLERSVAKNDNPITRYHLAMVYLKTGNEKRGRELLQAALKTAPELPEARMAQAVLTEVTKGGGAR